MSQPAKFISCLVAFSAPLCGPSRQAPIGCGCMRERTRKASLRSWARIAPASRTASAWARSARCTCWRAAGSSTRCPTTGGGSTCCGPKSTGATKTGGPWMPRRALCGGWWIYTKIGSLPLSHFGIYLIKYLVCIVGNRWLLFFFHCVPVNPPGKVEKWIRCVWGGWGAGRCLPGRMSFEQGSGVEVEKGGSLSEKKRQTKGEKWGISLVVRCLRICLTMQGNGFIPVRGTKIPHATDQLSPHRKEPTWWQGRTWVPQLRPCAAKKNQ